MMMPKLKTTLLLYFIFSTMIQAQVIINTDTNGNATIENVTYTSNINDFKANIGTLSITNTMINTSNVLGLWAGNGTDLNPNTEILTQGDGLVMIQNLILPTNTTGYKGISENQNTARTTVTAEALNKFRARHNRAKESIKITAYPNPANNEVNINFPSNDEIKEVNVYDTTGKIVLTQAYKNKIDLTDIPSGTYLFEIKTKLKTVTQKIIKK